MFARAKGKKQKEVQQLQCQEQCTDHISILPFAIGIVACTFFLTTFLEIAVNG